MSRLHAQPGDLPQFYLEVVVVFLREGFLFGSSRSSYSLSIGGDDVDPLDLAAFDK
jgi:hypothetical protein